jgi:2-desacetyl-2-hydroxyethyl bacteriochlorophyllide A dehydrogenase
MRAAVAYAPHNIRITDVPRPELHAGEVLLNIRAVGICGSDIHLYRGDHPYRVFPLIYGHEFTATVAALGEGVSNVKVGDSVVVEPLLSCGHCYPCRIGRPNCCTHLKVIGVHTNGGLAETIVVPAHLVYRVPPELPPEVAALCEPFSIGMNACERGAITAADQVVVLGAGPIGITILAIAKSRGAKVAIVDLLPSRLELADQLGADLVINGSIVDVPTAVQEFTGGDGASVVVEATGSPRAMESTVDLAAFAGRIVLVGVTTKPVTFPGLDFTRKELTILGSRNNAGFFGDAVEFVQHHPRQVQQLITQRFPFEQVVDAFELADKHPEEVCKAVVLMN